MMWVCRAGKKSKELDFFVKTERIYMPWDGFAANYSNLDKLEEFRLIVEKEKNVNNRTTVSNLASQLYQFVNGISIGDYVLIPCENSWFYHLAKVIGGYNYSDEDYLRHSRKIEFIIKDIPREIFDYHILSSLGAYRTLFKAKNEQIILDTIKKWEENKNNKKLKTKLYSIQYKGGVW